MKDHREMTCMQNGDSHMPVKFVVDCTEPFYTPKPPFKSATHTISVSCNRAAANLMNSLPWRSNS